MAHKPGKIILRKLNRSLRFALLLCPALMPAKSLHAVTFSPAAVNDLTAMPGAAGGEIRLTWTAVGDDILSGDISGGKFAVNYATYAVSFNRSLAQVLISTDMVAMSRQVYTIPGLSPGVTYYFALWTRDEVPVNWSGISNTTSAWAQLGTVSTPAAPGGLNALALSSYSLHLSWTDNAVDEMGYRVLGSTPAIKAVLPADTTYYIETGLLPNTSYYRAAEVFNSAGADQSAPVTRYTLSNPSSGTYVSSRSSWTVDIAWQANGNPAATRWGVERSTDNFATYLVLVSSPDALTVRNYLDTGLADLTTYYYRVNSFNAEAFAGGYGAAASTVTLSTPTAPGGLGGAVLGVSSVSWTWTDNAYNETSYRLRTSTGGLIALLAAGATAYVETGLGGNQTCVRTVEAYNGAGYAVSAGTTSYTLSAPPSGVYVSSRSSWTVGIAWQANTNSAATRWGIERSSDNFSTDFLVLVSSADALTVLNYLDTGLADLTTYYYRVNSFNAEAFVSDYGAAASTVTLSTPTAPSGLTNLAVSPYSIEYNWADNAYNEDGYRIRSSTGILYLLPADATYYAETGLIPNTSYYREMEAYNGRGSAGAAFAVLYTSAAVPAGLSVISRSSWSVLLGWQGGGNSSGTVWGIERSLTPGFASSTTLKTSTENYTAFTYLDTGLSNMVQYFYHVRGFNGDGFSGPYSLTVSTITLSTPTVPAGFSGAALTQNSIRWAWTDASNNEDGFNLRNNGGGLVANEPPGSSFHTETGLSPNLPYIRNIESYNGAGSTATAKIFVYTLSAVPTMNPSVVVTSYSVLIAWYLNGNPAGTFWGVERSTDAFATSQTLKALEDYYSAMEYLDTAVLPDTLYYYRVKSYNGAGFESAAAGTAGMTLPAIVPDLTPPAAVPDLTAAQGQVGGEIRLSWTAPGDDGPAGNIAGGGLKIHYVTSSTVPLNINLAQIAVSTDMVAGSTQTYSIFGLNPGATYYLGLWTRDEAPLNWSALSNKTTALAQIPLFPEAPGNFTGEAVSTFSIRWSWTPGTYQDGYRVRNGAGGLIAVLPVSATSYVEPGLAINTAYTRYVQVYNFTGAANSAPASVYTLAAPPAGFGPGMVGYSSVTVSWTANGNPAGALYRLQRWDAQTATTTLDMSVLSASFTGLAEAGTYYFRVGAVNSAGLVSWSSASLTVNTLGLPRIDAGLPAQSGIHLELAQASGMTLVDIPPGAFSEPLIITLKTPLNYPSDAAPRPGRPAAAGLEILTDRAVQPGKPVVITITYTDADAAGLNPARLAIARYDTARGAWVALPSSADPANHRVTAQTTHFSLFRLFEVNPSLTVLNSRVYPNPFRPSSGHTAVNFDGLPGEAVLKIYAFDGSKVRVLKCNASGAAVWDGKNASGRDAASGLYFAYAESGSDSKIMTVVVQR